MALKKKDFKLNKIKLTIKIVLKSEKQDLTQKHNKTKIKIELEK